MCGGPLAERDRDDGVLVELTPARMLDEAIRSIKRRDGCQSP
jgi:hypothetical protein